MDAISSWLKSFRGNDSDRQIALNADIPVATLARQMRDGTVTVETVVKIARSYQVSVIPALIALDVLNEYDMKSFSSASSVLEATDEELVAEILRRMKAGSAEWVDQPISVVENDLAARRKARSNAAESDVRGDDYDDDALIDRINAGIEPIAAQKRTEPLDENYT